MPKAQEPTLHADLDDETGPPVPPHVHQWYLDDVMDLDPDSGATVYLYAGCFGCAVRLDQPQIEALLNKYAQEIPHE